MLTVHSKFEGDPGSKERVLYVAGEGVVKKLTSKKAEKFLDGLTTGKSVLFTSAHAADGVLIKLAEQGASLFSVNWHATGIEKGLPPEDIALRFSQLPNDKLRPFTAREDIRQLRHYVTKRAAMVDTLVAASNKLGAINRNYNSGSEKDVSVVEEEDFLKDFEKKHLAPLEKEIARIAKTIPECNAFNQICGIENGWNTAATVMAYVGDIRRFPNVASFWHYCGQHVVDGKAPKRAVGKAQTWNTRVRTALFLFGKLTVVTQMNTRWRPVYDTYLSAELEAHDVKCPGCKHKQGHSGARARRRVIKDVLKQFYLKVCPSNGDSNVVLESR